MTTRAVFLDYGHTLMDFERPEPQLLEAYHRINARLRDELEVEVPEAAALVESVSKGVDAAVEESYRAGSEQEVDIAAVYREVLGGVGLQLAPELLDWVMAEEQRAWYGAIRVSPDAGATLEELKRRGLRLCLVSNAAYAPANLREQLRHAALFEYFDGTVYSSELGVRKPNPAIYEAALSRVGVDPAGVVFVGDRVREDV